MGKLIVQNVARDNVFFVGTDLLSKLFHRKAGVQHNNLKVQMSLKVS